MTAQRTLVIGDIHGNLEALLGALKNANFDISKDRIICMGDYVDGWNDSFEVVRTLLEIKNNSKFENVFLLGNHDQWFMNVLQNDFSRLRNEEIIQVKGNKFPIGSFVDEEPSNFTNNKIQLEKGDQIYIFSDGYPDQFGGPRGKKFMYKRFRELLVKNGKESLNKQKELLQESLFDWMKDEEQVDDILVIGVRV